MTTSQTISLRSIYLIDIRIFTTLRFTSCKFDLSCWRRIVETVVLNSRRCTASSTYARNLCSILLSDPNIVPLKTTSPLPCPRPFLTRMTVSLVPFLKSHIRNPRSLTHSVKQIAIRSALRPQDTFASPCLSMVFLRHTMSISTSLFTSCLTLKSLTGCHIHG